MIRRKLGNTDIEVSALGMGCWAIGGPVTRDGIPRGWGGDLNDDTSIEALHTAFDLGINFIDTANVYGAGHSERVIGQAIEGRRDQVIIATKFGISFDEEKREIDIPPKGSTQVDRVTADFIKTSCEDSLRRLKTDYIDIYQYHIPKADNGNEVREVLEELISEGKIRYYGWSTDLRECAEIFAQGKHCISIQQRLNIFQGNLNLLNFCQEQKLTSINRSPIGMGMLTGKYSDQSTFPPNDIRSDQNLGSQLLPLTSHLKKIKDILTNNDRTITQGALRWILQKSPVTLPIPGMRTAEQVKENAGALTCADFTDDEMSAIDNIVSQLPLGNS